MQKTILVTGSTDGIGFEAANLLIAQGHRVLLHGRSPAKLKKAQERLSAVGHGAAIEGYIADLSRMSEVRSLATAVTDKHTRLDVLINNAGVYHAREAITPDGLDVRFAVNTVAPYLLTKELLSLLKPPARVINVSSAAQAPVDLRALSGKKRLSDGEAYAQSKLAIIAWSGHVVRSLKSDGPTIVSVNPGSMLASKMVKEAFGVPGRDIQIGAKILVRAALSEEFESASGAYFDNDSVRFGSPHPDALDERKSAEVVSAIEAFVTDAKA